MTTQQYVQITRAAAALREARLTVEIARLQLLQADGAFASAMRASGLDPAVAHQFDDENLTITPLEQRPAEQLT